MAYRRAVGALKAEIVEGDADADRLAAMARECKRLALEAVAITGPKLIGRARLRRRIEGEWDDLIVNLRRDWA